MKTEVKNYTDQTHVYEAYDAFGNLLYVGITNNLKRRLKEHSASSKWWTQQTEIKHTLHSSRYEALKEESYIIAHRSPVFNIAQTDKHAEAVRASWKKRKEQQREEPRFIVSPRETIALLSVEQEKEVDELIELLTAIKTFKRSGNSLQDHFLKITLMTVRHFCQCFGVDSVRWAASND